MRIGFIALQLLLWSSMVNAHNGDTLREKYAGFISIDTLQHHLSIIASDEFEGRETGKKGQKMAAKYLAKQFEQYGLEAIADSGYYQRYHVAETGVEKANMKILESEKELKFIDDFYFFSAMVSGDVREIDKLYFMGYGIDDSLYSDYSSLQDKPENIVIWEGEPVDNEGNYLMTGTGLNTEWSRNFALKLDAAKKHDVKNVFIINDDYEKMVKRLGYYLTVPRVSLWKEGAGSPELAVYYISPKMAKTLLGKEYKPEKIKRKTLREKEGQPFVNEVGMKVDIEKTNNKVATENVLGFIEGSSPEEEVLVLTAHYDHLGMRGDDIYNGADDDGSGTVALLEIARAFSLAKEAGIQPERSVLFMAVSGEEKGLLGSEYYAANPLFPMDKTVANLNIDMIGRNDENHEPNSEYVYIIGSDRLSTTLHEISEETNESCCGLELDYTYNDPNDPNRFYYRSDHYNFVKNGVPAIFYFSGVHEDYHQPSDTVDKIQFGKMTSIVELVFHTAWNIAFSDREIVVDVKASEQ